MPGFQEIPVHLVEPSPYQPRKDMDAGQLNELAESIRAEGLLQPVVVRQVGEKFQLIAGERRWRAFQQLKIKTIPARILEASDASSATLTLIENLQREGLNPIDEAYGYASLIRDFDLTQEQASERVGRGRATVANSLRLLSLDAEIQGYLAKGLLSVGHAKVLLGVEDPARRGAPGAPRGRGGAERAGAGKARAGTSGARAPGGAGVGPCRRLRPPRWPTSKSASAPIWAPGWRCTIRRSTAASSSPTRGNDDLQRILEKLGLPPDRA